MQTHWVSAPAKEKRDSGEFDRKDRHVLGFHSGLPHAPVERGAKELDHGQG